LQIIVASRIAICDAGLATPSVRAIVVSAAVISTALPVIAGGSTTLGSAGIDIDNDSIANRPTPF
jgi:hypothetical protein